MFGLFHFFLIFSIFSRLEDVSGMPLRAFFLGFGTHARSSESLKTFISFGTSIKNEGFLVLAPKILPDSALAVFRSGSR